MGELTGLVSFVSVRPLRTVSAASRLGQPPLETRHINTGDELLGREILDFIEEGARRQRENARAR